MEFHMDHQFRQEFEKKESSVKFQTHKELDLFVQGLKDKDLEFEFKYKSEMILLKSFDRAFWLRYFKSPNNKITQPITAEIYGKEIQKCPFGNPRETKSMF